MATTHSRPQRSQRTVRAALSSTLMACACATWSASGGRYFAALTASPSPSLATTGRAARRASRGVAAVGAGPPAQAPGAVWACPVPRAPAGVAADGVRVRVGEPHAAGLRGPEQPGRAVIHRVHSRPCPANGRAGASSPPAPRGPVAPPPVGADDSRRTVPRGMVASFGPLGAVVPSGGPCYAPAHGRPRGVGAPRPRAGRSLAGRPGGRARGRAPRLRLPGHHG